MVWHSFSATSSTCVEKNTAITAFLPDNPDLYEFMSGISYLNLIADLYSVRPSTAVFPPG